MNDVEELVMRAAKGDRAAFDKLYTLTRNGVWYTCISLLKNEENAKDIMQDTYLTAYERLAELKNPASVQSWLNRIAANKCKNYLTSVGNRTAAEDSEEILENIPDDFLLPDEYVTDKAKRKIIMDIIKNTLSEEQYRTVVLYYFDEMTAAEIAQLMGCHEKTVLYRLKTARMKIKEKIMRYEEESKDKLHGVIPIAFLARLFKAEADDPSASVPAPALTSPLISQQTQPSQSEQSSQLEQRSQSVQSSQFEQRSRSAQPPQSIQQSQSTQSNDISFNVPSQYSAKAVRTGGKRMFDSLKAKIIMGACAAAVIVGGTAAGVIALNGGSSAGKLPTAVTDGVQQAVSETVSPSASSKPDNTPQSENTPASEKTQEPEPEKTEAPAPKPDTIPLSDEIVNAAFDSCLIQISNQVIKQGGYMTVAEYMEAYGDSCKFYYQRQPYEEVKGSLIPYLDNITYSSYALEVQPEIGNSFRLVIANCTSPDEKIPIEEAIVIKCENFMSAFKCPIWSPKGWAASTFTENDIKKYELTSTNKNYSLKDFPDYLKSEGIEEYAGDAHLFPPCTLENCKKYVRSDTDGFGFYVAGEPNLFGARPIFKYWIFFDPNTDKVQDKITSYELVGFISE